MFAKKALLGAAAMAVLTLAGCSTPDSHEPADLQDFREMVSPKVSWTASVGENDGYLTPAVTDNAVYAAGGDSLYRLDRLTATRSGRSRRVPASSRAWVPTACTRRS